MTVQELINSLSGYPADFKVTVKRMNASEDNSESVDFICEASTAGEVHLYI